MSFQPHSHFYHLPISIHIFHVKTKESNWTEFCPNIIANMFIKMQALGILLQYLHSLLKKLGMKCVLGQFQILMSVYVQIIPVFCFVVVVFSGLDRGIVECRYPHYGHLKHSSCCEQTRPTQLLFRSCFCEGQPLRGAAQSPSRK